MTTNARDDGAAPDGRAALGLRWWPLLPIAGLALIGPGALWSLGGLDRAWRVLGTMIVGVLVLLAFFLWLALGARLRGRARLGAVGAVLLGALALLANVRVVGVSGDLVPVLEWRWGGRPAELTGPGAEAAEVTVADYPQFQGPDRDGFVRGVQLQADWTAHPPIEVWRRPVGEAWSAFAIAGERAVTQEQDGEDELVVCYDLRSGERLWSHAETARFERNVGGIGPRATPTIADGRVFAMGATGILVCLDLETGAPSWRADTWAQAKAKPKGWGDACSPLVMADAGLVVVNPGTNAWTLAAYRIADGEVAWHAGGARPGYSSPVRTTLAGRDQILMFCDNRLVAQSATDGAPLWEVRWLRRAQCVSTPLVLDGDRVLVSSGYGAGGRLYRITRAEDGTLEPEELWHGGRLAAKFTNLIPRDGVVYGLTDGVLSAFSLEDGKRLWRGPRYGHGQVIAVGELLLVQAESGALVLVRVDPDGFEELGRVDALSSKTWNPPAFAPPFLIVRNDREAVCYRLAIR